MRKLALLISLLLMTGCSSSQSTVSVNSDSVNQVTRAWLNALESGNFEQADEYVMNPRLETSQIASQLGISDWMVKQAISYLVDGFTVERIETGLTTAEVDVVVRAADLGSLESLKGQDLFSLASSLISADKTDYEITVYLQDQNGEWKIQNVVLDN